MSMKGYVAPAVMELEMFAAQVLAASGVVSSEFGDRGHAGSSTTIKVWDKEF